MRSIDAVVYSSRRVISSMSMKRNSYALTIAISSRPMFVGDVRIATTGTGSS